jgi:hypothetical protein
VKPEPPLLEAEPAGADQALWRRLVAQNRAAYRVEARGAARRRTHLQSAKILDASGAFVCDATVQDASDYGLRLALARNCSLPSRFGVHLDLTREALTATVAWRRERVVGVRVLAHQPPAPLKPSQRAALAGRYYALRG